MGIEGNTDLGRAFLLEMEGNVGIFGPLVDGAVDFAFLYEKGGGISFVDETIFQSLKIC